MYIRMVGGTNLSRVVNSSAQVTRNWIPELDPEGKYPMRLIQRPGLANFVAAGSNVNRGMIEWGGDIYAVFTEQVHKITTAGNISVVGTLSTSSGRVGMAGGRTYMMIVDGAEGYYSDGSTVTLISDSDFPLARSVVWMDEYFIVDDSANPGRMWRSDANDPSSWGSTNFATAERHPDDIMGFARIGQTLGVIGESSTEFWYNDGSNGFSFAPVTGAFTRTGALARFTVRTAGGTVFWLGRTDVGQGAVFMSKGLEGTRVSTPAIEREINNGSQDITGASADTLYLEGHLIYLLHIPGGKSLAYDEQSGLWHEWSSYGQDDFRGRNAVHVAGDTYFGDGYGSAIYKLDWTKYADTDSNDRILRLRRDRYTSDTSGHRLVRHKLLEVEMEGGTGTATLNPQVMMRYSDDGGHQWSVEHWRGMGLVGQYKNRVRYAGLGASRDRVYEISISDPVKASVIGAYIEAA